MVKIAKRRYLKGYEYLILSGVKPTDLIKSLEQKYHGELRSVTVKGKTTYAVRRKRRR